MVHRAAMKLTNIMTGVSINSAVLVPMRGTTSGTRTVPSTKPAPKTRAKYSPPDFQNLHLQTRQKIVAKRTSS